MRRIPMQREAISFSSESDGLTLKAYAWRVPGRPRGVVVIAHGMGEHSLRYERFAHALQSAGHAVLAIDHRGHGASPGPGGLGDFGRGGWVGLVDDVATLLRRAGSDHPGVSVTLFGHSMGSFAAQLLCLDRSDLFDAAVLSGSTALDHMGPIDSDELRAEGLQGFNAGFEPARTPFDWLSRDEAEVDRYIADPHCGFDVTPASLAGLAATITRLADPEALRGIRDDLPVLLVAGDADPLNDGLAGLQLLEERWRAAGVSSIETQYYAGGRHEMLNETNREEVTRAIIDWLDRTLPAT